MRAQHVWGGKDDCWKLRENNSLHVQLIKDFSLPPRRSAKSQAVTELLLPLDFDSFALQQLNVWLWCSNLRLRDHEKLSPGKRWSQLYHAFAQGLQGMAVLSVTGLRGNLLDMI